MSETDVIPKGLIPTDQPTLFFEDNAVGRMKKEIWDASEEELDAILAEYGMPSPCEWGVPGAYIQTTPRHKVVENRRKNDIVLIPIGCTENHGMHLPSAADTLYVSQIAEGVRRYTEKYRDGHVNLTLPPLNFGSHPYHHMGMPGTVPIRENVSREFLIDTMLGLWNDGFRKQIMINNHGHLWMLESAIHQFQKRYHLPGIFRVIDWHRAVREFFRTTERARRRVGTPTSSTPTSPRLRWGSMLHPDMVDMEYAVDTDGRVLSARTDTSTSRWIRSGGRVGGPKGEGHFAIEIAATPEGCCRQSDAWRRRSKAKRPLAAILRYLTLLQRSDSRLPFPAGTVPPVEKVTLRTEAEMEPYLREPLSEGWKPVYGLARIGQDTLA